MDSPDHVDHKVPKVHKDHKVPKELRVRRGLLVALDHQADQLVPPDHKVPQDRVQLALVD